MLLAKGCQHICLPKGEHYSLGVPEKAIGDLDRNTRAVMADANIPPMYWDIVVQHVATERKSSEQMSNWMRKMNLEYF